MRVFLDVGAHVGQTLGTVRHPRWGFDRIVCFEPAPSCWPLLRALADDRVEVCEFGLWHRDEVIELHNPGLIGASVSDDKRGATDEMVPCQFRDVAEWMRANLSPEDEVYVKVNIEGAEAELIDRLAETGTLGLVDHLMLHFDVRKVPSKRHLEPRIHEQLTAAGVDYIDADRIIFDIPDRGVGNWLRWVDGNPLTRDLLYRGVMRGVYAARRSLYPTKRALIAKGLARPRVTDSHHALTRQTGWIRSSRSRLPFSTVTAEASDTFCDQ